MLGSTVILARLLSPHDYGLVAMVVAVIGVGEIFRDFGLSMAALQAKELTQQQQSNLFWINTAVGAVLALFFFGVSFLLGAFYGEPEVVAIAQVLSATFLFGGVSTQYKVSINRELRFVALAIVDLIPYVLAFVGALTLAILFQSYWALVAQQLIVAVATLVLAILLSRWRPGLPRRAPMGGLISFGASFAATQLVSYATRNVDSIAIGKVWGSTSLGFYDRAYNLLLLPLTQINTPMSRVAVPVLSRISEERERYVAYLRRAQLVALYVTATLFCFLAALSTPLVVLVLGEKWEFAGQILGVLALGGVFRAIVQIAYWVYMSLGLATAQLRFYLVAQPLLVVVILLGLPWGPMGVAVTHSVGYALFWAVSLAWASRVTKLDLRPLYFDALRAIGLFGLPAAVAAYGASFAVSDFGPAVQVLAGGLAAIVWYAVAWLLFRRVRTDVSYLVDFVRLALRRGKGK
ncbi:lipopolysaccharide biosynthesis protein [Agromyces atrinae]|nr:lipopolysaccharide biosynthesis protein [Agromyces atrinae]